jgi:uncharacterized protein (TIGR04255 family)
MAHPHLERAPIVEALVDLRIEPELPGLPALEPFERAAAHDFPDKRPMVFFTGSLDLRDRDEPKASTPLPDTRGYACWSADKRRVVQGRVNGFSFSHLGPYDRWQSLREDARQWWQIYRGATNPLHVTRCALRFINRMELPLPMRDLADFLRTLPQIGAGLPQSVSGLFMRLVLPFPAATAIITQAVEDSGVTPQVLPVILDIEAFVDGPFAPEGEDVWSRLEELRQVKNDVFFQSITAEAVNLFR